jgi:hypothetical protein
MVKSIFILCLLVPALLYAPQQILLKRTSSFTAPPAGSPFDDALSVWPLDETSASSNAIDAQGANDLTQTGSPAAQATGLPSNLTGARIGVSDDYFTITDAAFTGDFLGNWTISAWCKPSSSGAGEDMIITKYLITGSMREVRLFYDHATTTFKGDASSTGTFGTLVTVTYGSTSAQDAWHHVVMRHVNGATIGLIVNNGTEATAAFTGNVHDGTANLLIGARQVSSDQFVGEISQTAIWKRLLSASEITTIYAAGAGLDYP